jgi:hypothetical protein
MTFNEVEQQLLSCDLYAEADERSRVSAVCMLWLWGAMHQARFIVIEF